MIHSPQSLADMLERDYFPTTSSLGKNLYLAYDEWRMVIDALRAQRAEAVAHLQMAAELGYRCAEKGMNPQAMLAELRRSMNNSRRTDG